MKNKKKKLLFFLILFLSIGFFGFGFEADASVDDLIVTEFDYQKDWIEIYNPSVSDVSIAKTSFGLIDRCAVVGIKEACHTIKEDLTIKSGDFFIIADNKAEFLSTYSGKSSVLDSSFDLLSTKAGCIRISEDNCENFFIDFLYDPAWGGKSDKRTLEKNNFFKSYLKEDWQESFVDGGSPGAESSKKPAPKIYSTGVALNEILPNPSGGEEEYIEILNSSAEDVDLIGWILRDGSKTGKYVFPVSLILPSGKWLAVYKKDFKFALNDSGEESVHLLNPEEKEVSVVNYAGAKDGLSYGLEGAKWRWSKTLTPGAENVFDSAPNFKVIKDDTVYKNFPANFDVNIKKYKKSKYKITWNFGDGHKSYLKKVAHKYEKNGKYKVSVKIFNGSEEVIKEFKIEVKSFPKYDVEIISVNPNPEGSDTDLETLTVRNNSKKKVDLQNWSIATGDKKLTNHPIALKTILKPKETLKITRALSKFTLNNKKAQVELRYPSGKVASKMKYDKKVESIAEGEILEKTKLGWVWKNTSSTGNVPQVPDVSRETNLLVVAPEIEQNLEMPQILGESDVKADVPLVEQLVGEGMLEGGQSTIKNKKDFKVILASFVYSSPVGQFTENINQTRIRPVFDFNSFSL